MVGWEHSERMVPLYSGANPWGSPREGDILKQNERKEKDRERE